MAEYDDFFFFCSVAMSWHVHRSLVPGWEGTVQDASTRYDASTMVLRCVRVVLSLFGCVFVAVVAVAARGALVPRLHVVLCFFVMRLLSCLSAACACIVNFSVWRDRILCAIYCTYAPVQ